MRVIVTRAAGDKTAPEVIVYVLCNVQVVGEQRGRQYLYDEGFNKRLYDVSFPYRQAIYPTDLVAVHDGSMGESFVGRVVKHAVSIKLTDDTIDIESQLIVERKEGAS